MLLLTNISAAVILNISLDDITDADVTAAAINVAVTNAAANETDLTGREQRMESIALTEAVYYILLSLDTPLHGYGIMQNAERLSGGRVRLAAGTLYGALNTLLEKGWIKALPGSNSSRKKEYQITEAGRSVVMAEIRRLRELLHNGEEITGGWKNEEDNS